MKKQHSLRFILIVTATSLLAMAIFACALFTVLHYRSSEITREQQRLSNHAVYLREANLSDKELDTYAAAFSLRITIIKSDGTVSYDTYFNPKDLDNHLYRQEIKDAFAKGTGTAIRSSANAKQQLLYEALLTDSNEVIRVSRELSVIKNWTYEFLSDLALIFLALLLLSMLTIVFIINHTTKALEILTNTAIEYSKGNLSHHATVIGPTEYTILSETLNGMAVQLQQQFKQLQNTSFEFLAIFNAMEEGIVLIDSNLRILLSNNAFDRIFAHNTIAKETPLRQWVFSEAVQTSIEKAFTGQSATPCCLTVCPEGSERMYFQVCMAPVAEKKGKIISLVLTFTDITKTRRLELVRKDFVANVSHELKTPLTSIGGFAEILVNKQAEGKQAQQFLEIIFDNVKQMQLIVEDLLLLASLENDEKQITMQSCSVEHIIEESLRRCTYKASMKKMVIESKVQRKLYCMGNEGLLIQAMVNLILNAILYSEEGKTISIVVEEVENQILFKVQDQGCGIAEENLERIFERFYRVDKARSRKEGGTGLGLSIVKHIANIHNGNISVESHIGEGSTFTLSIPQ
ncbi:signal transduction histidine kinase [Sphaerochaeta pleomorpha str. Grapes]|uniref:histidine kinase n=1 Tax=Sphaerochaeta pleomorpha (strain ATCC BAA-1885 / DSM 22778 / Grapes) TaxID=158190 RepID=G8QTK2_SPHPG|nr:ATP-binding protein [Sphaerochaeta pleomorpha]AEV27967.1 signal transduction histidine kinase [Sphaerochaeta pleomorpha str. Grapes]